MDILQRPEPWHDVPAVVADFLCLVCAPWHLVQYLFPLRYFTSWCHLAIIAYLVACLPGWWCNSLVQGALWILALYLPPSSFAIMAYSAPLRGALVRSCGWPLCVAYQLLVHLVPSALVFLLTEVPRPWTGPWSASLLFASFMFTYNVVLHVAWHTSALDNYYLIDSPARDATIGIWAGTLLWACATGEALFVLVGRAGAAGRF